MEVQYEYLNRSLEVLNEVRSSWGQPLPSIASAPRHNTVTASSRLNALSRTSSNNSTTGDDFSRSPRLNSISRKGSSTDISSPPPRRVQNQRSMSFSDREENSNSPVPVASSRVMGAPYPPPVLPRRQCKVIQTLVFNHFNN